MMPGSSDIDEYDLVDPVDILTPLGKSSFWDGVVSTHNDGNVARTHLVTLLLDSFSMLEEILLLLLTSYDW